ncbi:mobilization protein [Thiocystis violacea]|uniref:mobilization protein n=1 Tax=Thiocystis violacea TaxID=13725 RepID=UPI00190724CB|nr:mobilization protein [Thiocystis violacea]MBK1723866.1 mobilization protein [Thiocystis violacea]
MSRIHFIGGEKGGVGKSVLARLLAQYHIDKALAFTAFDTDRSHGTLLRFYGDFSQPIALDDAQSADRIMETALEAEQNILVDLAAQTSTSLHRWIDQTDLLALASEEGTQIVFWHVLDDGADSIALLDALLARYEGAAAFVVVRNHGRGKDFANFTASPAHAKAQALGVPVMDLPELHAASMRKIDHANTSLWAAAHNKDAGLGLMDRQRVKVWLNRSYQQLDLIPDLLCGAALASSAQEPGQ